MRNELLKSDLFRIIPKPYSFFNLLKGFRNQGFRYLFFKRLKSKSFNRVFTFIYRIIIRHYTYKFGFQIPVENIGGGFYIGHFGTVVVSVNAKIGRNCNIAHNVTIGAARGERSGAPQIGDFVWMGTGSVIVGNIKIGNNVLIAPNSFVNFDVPDNSIVIGNPGKIIHKKNPTKDYINNIYPFPDILCNDN